ncbi:cation:proton antiporter [Sandaracinus amylolyticus]|uniref:Na(+)/H(+) antiporter n=1 Tax=Sandaracinus amylolyticus TaxID=927083 RepID=A0A0F6W0E4_9BACT|nr:cation:proton antiporter [Sandaracinus amylolyticus]AKF04223.1 Na(+)/H(+) antiporter [Sandaracinus amylolyticus]
METSEVLRSLEHHALLVLLVQLGILLAAARLLGELARKLGQPAVIGELAAGVLLGPSGIGALAPATHAAVFPHDQAQADLLAVVSWIGVLFLILVTGMETDLGLVRRQGKTALSVSAAGVIVPFATGFAIAWLVPVDMIGGPDQRLVFALFLAVAMSISAVPVIAKVLIETRLVRRDVGQLMLAAGMADDTLGWILLSVVAGLASRGELDLLHAGGAALTAIVTIGLGLTLGRRVFDAYLRGVDRAFGGAPAQLSAILVAAFLAAAGTHAAGIEAVLGTFIVGILAGQSRRLREDVTASIEMITTGFVAPIFFASAGLRVDLALLLRPDVLGVGLAILAVACIGKLVGAYVGAWIGGRSHWERLAMGAGMNARGAMEIVVATIGLGLGVLGRETYSIIVMIAIVTSMMAPPLLRFCLRRVEMTPDERARLEREQMATESFLLRLRRAVLVPSDGTASLLAARLLGLIGVRTPLEVSIVDRTGGESAAVRYAESLAKHPKGELRTAQDEKTARRVEEDADLLAMGAPPPRKGISRFLFGPRIDRKVLEAKQPVLVVDAARGSAVVDRLAAGEPIRRIVVPVIGTEYSRRAVELASGIAAGSGAALELVHVVASPDAHRFLVRARSETIRQAAQRSLEHFADIAHKLGAEDVTTQIIEADSTDGAIVREAGRSDVDLVLLGVALRPGSERAFFGPKLEELVRRATRPVVVLAS